MFEGCYVATGGQHEDKFAHIRHEMDSVRRLVGRIHFHSECSGVCSPIRKGESGTRWHLEAFSDVNRLLCASRFKTADRSLSTLHSLRLYGEVPIDFVFQVDIVIANEI
jgi:hypothetical protein